MKKIKSKSKKKNIFTSKADVLSFLNSNLKNSKIEKIYSFVVDDWKKNREEILQQIELTFNKKKVIIRSSAIGEDSDYSSEAGSYESILNIDSSSKKQLISGIQKVIKSYEHKKNFSLKNQVLIQTQTTNVVTSGVIFTRTSDFGSPYYVINFEDGKSTTGVTHGLAGNTIKISRNLNIKNIEKKWKNLLRSVKEIENLVNSSSLDIEFGINKKSDIIIFQVRPMTTILEPSLSLDDKIAELIKKNKKKYLQSNTQDNLKINSMFSDMTDWNPAEIIGNNPKPLDYSLYDFLIMNHAWYKGREEIGYKKFYPHKLMKKFGNKPYVDIKYSFHSLIPDNFDKKLSKKLLIFYLEKLVKNPHLHDKAEFEILFTCYDFTLHDRLKELRKYNFTNNEIKKIHDELFKFTENIIKNFPSVMNSCNKSITKMNRNRIQKIQSKNESYFDKLSIAESLLNDCKNFGTIPFSLMARIAFISSTILKSFSKNKIFPESFIHEFMNSLETPLSQFQNDLTSFSQNKITKKIFLEKYGHLRPGTYDITIPRYDKENKFLQNIKFQQQPKPKPTSYFSKKFKNMSKIHTFDIPSEDLFFFLKESLILRENLKFEFTRNLSDAIELIADAGKDLGFFREDLSYIEINNILKNFKKLSKNQFIIYLQKNISQNKKEFQINNHLVMPSIISSEKDFDLIALQVAKPNFITNQSITSGVINLDRKYQQSTLNNKIILLEHADPGFDWIFSRNPSGLITKYGGVASHMSIRCSEINLPAAIGCGSMIYEKLKDASKIILDCKNQQIIPIEYEKLKHHDEEKKVLKSLGYIR